MCSVGLHTPDLEPEQTKSLLTFSVSASASPRWGNEILFIFTFLGSKYTLKIQFNLLGWCLQAGRQRELRQVVS